MKNILGVTLMLLFSFSCSVPRDEVEIIKLETQWINQTHIVAGQIVNSWSTTEADRILVKQIIEKDTTLSSLERSQYIKYDLLNETVGIYDDKGNRFVSVQSEGNNHETKTFLLINFNKKLIYGIDKNLTPQHISQLSSIGSKRTTQYLDENYGSKTARQYQQVIKKSQSLIIYIDSLKNRMVDQTGGYYKKNQTGYERLKGKANRSIASEVFIHKGHGKKLEKKINDLRSDFLALGKNSKLPPVPPERIPLKIDYEKLQQKAIDWPMYTFNQIPLAAALPMLTKIQVDVSNSLNVLLKNSIQ